LKVATEAKLIARRIEQISVGQSTSGIGAREAHRTMGKTEIKSAAID